MDNKLNPLFEFENLIQNGGIIKHYNSFSEDRKQLNGHFTNTINDTFTFQEQDHRGEWIVYKDSFQERINKSFQDAYDTSIQGISDQLSSILTTEDLEGKIKHYLDSLQYLYNLSHKNSLHGTNPLAVKWVLKTIKFLHQKYPSFSSSHSSIYLLTDQPDEGIVGGLFKFNHGMRQLGELYEIVCHLDLFAKDETAKGDFIKVFSAENPELLDLKLEFSCSEEKASYIIKLIRPLFENFTDMVLEKSKSFITNIGTEVTQRNIQSARSKYNKDISKEDERTFIASTLASFKRR